MSFQGCAWARWQDLKLKQVCNSSQSPQGSEATLGQGLIPVIVEGIRPNICPQPICGGCQPLVLVFLPFQHHSMAVGHTPEPPLPCPVPTQQQEWRRQDLLVNRQGPHEKPRSREISRPLPGMTMSLDTTRLWNYRIIKLGRDF